MISNIMNIKIANIIFLMMGVLLFSHLIIDYYFSPLLLALYISLVE